MQSENKKYILVFLLIVTILCFEVSLQFKVETPFIGRESFGAESNPTGNPIGGGAGYNNIYTSTDPRITTVVTTKAELVNAISNAGAGDIIFINSNANIDLSNTQVRIPAGVTLASDRGYSGSTGAKIFQTASVGGYDGAPLLTNGPGVRITGLRIEGPDMTSAFYSPNIIGVVSGYDNTEIDNCEIYGWGSGTAVLIYGPTGGGKADASGYIHHNYIHHNQMNGMGVGYGVLVTENSKVLVEGNYFDYNRVDIVTTGRANDSYEARYNIVGPDKLPPTAPGYGIGMGSIYWNNTQGIPMSANLIVIHHNTFQLNANPSVGLEGISPKGMYINHNWMLPASSMSWSHSEPVYHMIVDGNFFMNRNVIGTSKTFYESGPYKPLAIKYSLDLNLTAPTLYMILNKKITAGSSLAFLVDGADPNNLPLKFNASGLPRGAKLTQTSSAYDPATFSWTPTSSQVGSYPVTFMASNGHQTATETVTITVLPGTDPINRIIEAINRFGNVLRD